MKFENLQRFEACVFSLPEYELKDLYTERGEKADGKYLGVFIKDTNKLIQAVSKKYILIQHKDVLLPFIDFLKRINAKISGCVFDVNGKMIAEITFDDKSLFVKPDDEIKLGVTIINSVDRSSSIKIVFFGKRVVCENGMYLNVGNISNIKEIHYGDKNLSKNLIEFYAKTIKKLQSISEVWNDVIQRSMQRIIEDKIIEYLLAGSGFGKYKIKYLLKKIKEAQAKTGWDIYNVITEWLTHEAKISWDSKKYYHDKASEMLISIANDGTERLVEQGKTILEKEV